VDAVSSTKRLEIARWFYGRALRDVRAESSAVTWAALLRAAQNLRYVTAAVEKKAAAAQPHRDPQPSAGRIDTE
jgi:hypothetical protein